MALERIDEQSLLEEMAAIKQGDQLAFQRVYQATWSRLYAIVAARVADASEAEDIVQDVYVNFWERRAALEISGSVTGYLIQMAKNEVIKRVKKAIKSRDTLSVYASLVDESLYPSYVQLFVNELEKQLQAEIDRLPRQQQLIYRLHTIERRSASEISRSLNLAEQTVKNQLSTANRRIRMAMKSALQLALLLLLWG